MWQGTSFQVEKWLCPECGGQRDGESGHCWGVLTSEGVFSGAGATAYGRRCGEKSWAYRKRRYSYLRGGYFKEQLVSCRNICRQNQEEFIGSLKYADLCPAHKHPSAQILIQVTHHKCCPLV